MEHKKRRNSGLITFLALLVGYTLSQFYRSFLAVIAPELSTELHLNAADLGYISASWFAAFALAQFPVGVALDRHGPRGTLAILALVGTAGAIVFARASGATEAMVGMALIGVGCSGALMGALFMFAHTFEPRRFAMLSSLIIGLGGFGNLLGGTPLAVAASEYGWRSVFYCLSAIGICQAVLVLLLIRHLPAQEAHHGDDGGILHGLRELFSRRGLWPLWPIMTVSYGILITERGLWVGPYLSDVYALSQIPRGNIIFAFAMAISLGALAYGPLETWIRKQKPLVLGGSVLSGLAMGALALVPDLPLSGSALLLCLFGFAGMTYGPLMSHVRMNLPGRLLGRGMTFANFLCMSGAGLLQVWSGGYVRDLKATGLPAAEVFSYIHQALAAILLGAAIIYAFTQDRTNPST